MSVRATHVRAGPTAAHDCIGENRVARRERLATHRNGWRVDRFVERVGIGGQDAAFGSDQGAFDPFRAQPGVVDRVDHDPVADAFELRWPPKNYHLGAYRLQAEIDS